MDLFCYSRSHKKLSGSRGLRQAEAGQAVVEYILMLVIATAIAALVVRTLVRQSSDDPGVVISKWNDLVSTISSDATDEAK